MEIITADDLRSDILERLEVDGIFRFYDVYVQYFERKILGWLSFSWNRVMVSLGNFVVG